MLLTYQWVEGMPFQIASIIISLVIILPIFILSRSGRENLAAYISMSIFLGMFSTMIIVGSIFNNLTVVSLGGMLGSITAIMFIIFHTKWRDQ